MCYALEILTDGLFAALAAIGFGAVSHPPRRSFVWIAFLGALGHAVRFVLMQSLNVDIAFASFLGALTIGFAGLWPAWRIRVPATCLYIPALLPMIPGIYAYKSVFSLISFMRSLGDGNSANNLEYMNSFFLNATVSCSVVFLLAIGVTIPLFLHRRHAFSMTRYRRK